MNKFVKRVLLACRRLPLLIETKFDKDFLSPDVPASKMVSHQKWQRYLYELGNRPGMRILEVGSREVTGKSAARKEFSKAKYVGFDFYPGNNIDIARHPHNLPSYLQIKQPF